METNEQSFTALIESLRNPPPSLRREARIVRRTAVVLAILDVLAAGDNKKNKTKNDTSTPAIGDAAAPPHVVTASKVYAQCITALEGTLTNQDTTGTQIALLDVLSFVLPHVEPLAILSATLPLTSRVLRAVVALAEDQDETMKGENEVAAATDQTGGANALLRWVALVSSILMVRLPDKDEKDVQQLLTVTLLNHFNDRRPKVRKAVHNHTVEMLSRPKGCPRIIVRTISKFCHEQLAPPLHEIVSSSALANGTSMDWYQQSSHLFAFLERAMVHLHFTKLTEDIMGLLTALLTIPKQGGSELFVTTKIKHNTPRVLAISSLAAVMLTMLQDEDERRQDAIDELAPRVLASVLRGQTAVILNEDAAEYEVLDKARVLCGQLVLHACSRSLLRAGSDGGMNNKAAAAAAAVKLMPLALQFVRTMSLPSVDGDIAVAQTLMAELAQHLRMLLPHLRNEPKCLADSMKTLQVVVQEPKYRATWPVSLKCLTILLPYLSDETSKADIFESLLAAHSNKASAASKTAVEDAISTLVQQIGIEPTWNWICWNPASPKGGIATERAWLLNALKNAATTLSNGENSTRLDFFQSAIMPLARLCDQLAATRPPAERNFHRTCVIRVWELFPCFCTSPEDVEEIFPSLSDTLCKALGDTRYPELLTTICNGLSILVKSTEDAGSFELEESSGGARAISTATMKLLPTLFKLVSDAHTSEPATSVEEGAEPDMDTGVPANDKFQKLQSVSEAIASISRLAPPDFLQGMFKKVMRKLLEQFQLESGESERICSLLTLAQAFVASEVLDEASVSFLYRALKPLIKDGEQESRVQKRAYKVLLQICERYSSFVSTPERFNELCELLTATVSNAQISARYMRLKCMNSLVKDMKQSEGGMSVLNGVVPEVLLCLKDSNGKTRDAAYQLLLTMAASSSNIMDYVNTILAGLGAETVHMRSAVVLALSRIVFEYGQDNDQVQEMLPQLLQTVLLLLGKGTRETVKSVVGFLRVCVSAIPSERLQPLVPDLLGSLMKSQLAKNRFRAKVKIIVKKLVKLYGYDALMRYIPQSDTRLLTHMRKLDEREKRSKQANRDAATNGDRDDFEGMLDSDEEDSDDGRTLMTGATGLAKSRLSQLKSQGSKITKVATKASTSGNALQSNVRLPDHDNGGVVDLLGKNMAGKDRFAPDDDTDDESMSDAMEFDDDGKLVVRDDADPGNTKTEEDVLHVKSSRNNKKRDRDGDSTRGPPANKTNKRTKSQELGSAYRSKKASGDVKRKDQKFEPYAFVPLDGRAFSKKNRRSAVEQMSTVVRGKGKKGKR